MTAGADAEEELRFSDVVGRLGMLWSFPREGTLSATLFPVVFSRHSRTSEKAPLWTGPDAVGRKEAKGQRHVTHSKRGDGEPVQA